MGKTQSPHSLWQNRQLSYLVKCVIFCNAVPVQFALHAKEAPDIKVHLLISLRAYIHILFSFSIVFSREENTRFVFLRITLEIKSLTTAFLCEIVFWYGLSSPIENAKWPIRNLGSLHHCLSEALNWGFGSNRIRHRRIPCTYKQNIWTNMALRLSTKSPTEAINSCSEYKIKTYQKDLSTLRFSFLHSASLLFLVSGDLFLSGAFSLYY